MAAQAGLSIAANAFAPIGLADVVFRAGKDVLDLVMKVRDAPEELALLQSAVRIVENAIAEASLYLTELSASEFVHEDHVTIPDITSILQNCHAEFNKLRNITKVATATPNDGWSLLWKRKTVFAFDAKEIECSQRRVHRYAQALVTTISVAKGRNQILLRNQLSSTRSDIVKASDNVLQHVANSEQVVTSSVIKAAQDAKAGISASLNNMQDIVQMQIANLGAQQRQGLASVQKGFQRNHLRQSGAMNQQLREIKLHGRQLKQIHQTVMSSMTIIEPTNDSIHIVGFNTEELLLPLILVKSQLAKIIPTLSQSTEVTISSAQLRWLRETMDELIASASFSRYHEHKNPGVIPCPKLTTKGGTRHMFENPGNTGISQTHPRHVREDIHTFETPVGTLVMKIQRSDSLVVSGTATEKTETLLFTFLPRLDICDIGFNSIFIWQPKVTRALQELRLYRVLPHKHKVFDAIRSENLLALRDLLGRHDISILDCNEDGQSLALCAYRRMRPESFNYLLDQGARVEKYSSSTKASRHDLYVNRTHFFSKEWYDMLPRAIETGLRVPSILDLSELGGLNSLIELKMGTQLLRSLDRLGSLSDFTVIDNRRPPSLFLHPVLENEVLDRLNSLDNRRPPSTLELGLDNESLSGAIGYLTSVITNSSLSKMSMRHSLKSWKRHLN